MQTTFSVTTKNLLAASQEAHGEEVGSFGGSLNDITRLPTGILAFDLATGGGIPRGKASLIFGAESSNKTNLVLRLMMMHQLMFPELTCIFFDIEHAWDPVWAKRMGVDPKRVIVMKPDIAELCVDIMVQFLHAEDCGLVIVDSIAAMVTANEIGSSAEKAIVGGASISIGNMVRKSTLALAEAGKLKRYPTLIYVNQVRHKFGGPFGDPERQPGGYAPRFQASMMVRLYGNNKVDPKINKAMPTIKEVSFIIKKWKVPVLATEGKFEMAMIAHDGLEVGACDDWNAISSMLKDNGQLEKSTKGWMALEVEYPTLQAFRDKLYGDSAFLAEVRQALIARALADGKLLEPME
jgi:recombination protein RecA